MEDKRTDDIMEEAKRKASQIPDTEVSVKLNEKETFTVTYNSSKDNFECSRVAKVGS